MTRAFVLLALVAVAAQAAFLPTTERAFETADFKGTFSNKVRQDDGCPNKVFINGKSGNGINHAALNVDGKLCNANGVTEVFDASEASKLNSALGGFSGPSKTSATLLGDAAKASPGSMVGVTSAEITCGTTKLAKGTMLVFIKSAESQSFGTLRFKAGNRVMAFVQPGSTAVCSFDSKPRDTPPTPTAPATPATPPASGATPPAGGATSSPAADTGAGAGGTGTGEAAGGDGPTPSPEADAGAGGAGTGETGTEAASPEPSPSTEAEGTGTGDGGSVCFPGSATVELADGSFKAMASVEIGDRVRVAGGKFSDIFMFTHKLDKVAYSFVKLDTASGHSLSLTAGHYLKVNGAMTAASTVVAGDSLELADGSVSSISRVSNVNNVGLFNPQTVEGSIVVDGVVASTYTTAVEMNAAHSMLAPLRAVYNFFGLSMAALESGADSVAPMLPKGNAVC